MSEIKLDPRKEFGAAVYQFAKENPAVIALSTDSGGSSGFSDIQKEFPERYIELGIMEQCATGVAAGLAAAGKIPVYCAIAPFVTSRNFEMMRNDLGYMRQNVKVVGRNGGITYSDLGSTHHSLEDFALMRSIPGMVVLCPQDPLELRFAVEAMLRHQGPVYMRIGNEPVPVFTKEQPFVIGKGQCLREGKDVAILSTGTQTGAVLEAVPQMLAQGVDPMIIGLPTIQPLDEEIILSAAKATGKVVTVEEHYIPGGLGSAVAEVLSQKLPTPLKMLGIPKEYASSGPYAQLMEYYRLDAKGIAESICGYVREG